MPITLPDFTALPQLTPQASGFLPQYPANDPGAAAEAKLGEGLEKVGQGVSTAGFYADVGKTKMDRAMADADFTNRIIPINEKLKTETDPEKITDLKAQYREALDIAGNAFSDPEARAFWAAQNLKHVTAGEAGADLRNSLVYNDRYNAGAVVKRAELSRTGVVDPDAFEASKIAIDKLIDAQIANGSISSTDGEKQRLKDKLDLVGGRIDHLISQGQYDQAQAVLNAHRQDIGGVMAGHIESTIATKKQAGDVSAAIRGYLTGGAGYTPGASLAAPVTSDDDLWSRMKTQEKGVGPAGEAKVSPAGAIGISQIKPGTAQEMAAKLGVPYDEKRLYTDHPYNESLGRRYLQDQLDKYGGNRVLAAAAYNAGPGQVDEWITKFGDPRKGEISDAQFAAQIPFSETRNYVQAVGAVPSAVVQGQGGATRNLPIAPTVNAQLDKAATTDGNLRVEVFSGGQPSTGENRVGSHRHDQGEAADIQLRDTRTGQLLDMRKPEDQARMKNFITAAVAAGATGVGAAEDYMGPHGIHIGSGPPAAWGRDGSSANAPGWVKGAFDAGRKQVGTQPPPGAPAAPAAAVTPAAPAATNALVPGQAVLGNTPLDAVPGGTKAIQSAAPIAITSGAQKGKYLLLPGVKADGSPATEDEALDQYEKDGKHLGIFNSPGVATAYANNRTGTGAAPAATSEQQRQYDETFKQWQAANPGSDPKIFTDYRARQGLYVPSAAAPPAGTAPAARPAGPQAFDAAGGDSIGLSAIKNADLPGTFADDKTKPVYTGADRKNPVKGRDAGQAMTVGGRDPTGNLDYVNAHPDEFQGKKVFWSTGLMNAGLTAEEARAALPKVREQLDTLVNGLKAQVVLVGVDKGKFAPLNKELEALAAEYKIPFAGALPTNDVHPGATAMKEYARKAAQLLPAERGDTGPPPAPTTAGTEDYATPDSEGGDYGGGGESAAPAATGTEPAAVSGGSREVRSPELITPSATPAPAAAGGTTGASITKPPPGGFTPHVDVTEIERSVDANMAAGVHTPEAAAKIKAGLIAELHRRDALVKPQRDELANTLTGGVALLKEGRPFDYNVDEIRHYYGKPDADKIIQTLDDARDAGKITAQVRGVTDPAQLDAMRADLQGKLDTGGAIGADKRQALFNHFDQVEKKRRVELDKSMVESEINRYFGAGPGLAAISAPDFGQQPARDTNDLVQRVQADIDYGRLKPDVGAEIQRGVVQRVNVLNAAEHNDKVALDNRINATRQALADGKQVEPIDPTTIRHYFTPDEADKRIQGLADAQEAGGYYAQIKNASPADIATQQYALEQRLNDPQATDYLARREQYVKYNAALTKRNEELGKDPGGYLQTNSPLVTEKFNALLTDDARKTPQAHAQAFADFAQATLAEQARLGVPAEQRTILSKGQAAATAAKLAALDPTKVDVVKELRNMALGYGAGNGSADYWPKVFGEMVKEGKLPSGYQVLASMTRPDQLVAAEDLSRALSLVAQKGGLSQIKEASSPDVKLKLDQALETELADFKMSTGEQAAGASLYDKVKDSAQALALYYGYKGQSQNEAVKHAVDGIIRNKYDFGETGPTTIRVPKGTLRDVERAADVAKAGVTLDQLGPVPVRDPVLAAQMTPDQAKSIWMNAIRDGGWVNNGDDSGIQLVGKFRDGAVRRIERFDGTPVELRFSDVPDIVRSAPALAPMGPEDIGLRLPPDVPAQTGQAGFH
jgi:hypothetical protein